ncbi:MAG TPA: AIM24 family protein, partial [Vicinamibacterales bacterium]|nr:AIM24 family protein [Vicinamibacterales bacterium]
MAQEQWYMAIGGHQVGPVSQEDVVTNLRNGTIDGNTLVFSAGMANWTPLKDVPVLAAFLTTTASRATAAAAAPPPITGKRAHEIDFKILGSEMQFVEVELDPGESAVAEAGSMMYMTPGIQMETVFGDGSQQRTGVMGALLGAGKRLITGESLFMTVFTNQGSGKQQVAFAAPYPGKILAMDLKQ